VTPSVLLIEQHYKKAHMRGKSVVWFLNVAKLIGATPYELGAVCGLTVEETDDMINRGTQERIPAPVAIHAAIIRAWYLETIAKEEKASPVVPIHLIAAAQHLEQS
jgi:hypothetical protein